MWGKARLEILNPFRPLLSESEASFAARAGAVVALLTAASSVAVILRMHGQMDRMRAVIIQSAGLKNVDLEVALTSAAAMDVVLDLSMGIPVALGLAYLVFGLIQ